MKQKVNKDNRSLRAPRTCAIIFAQQSRYFTFLINSQSNGKDALAYGEPLINTIKGVFMGWMIQSPPRAPPPPMISLHYTIPAQAIPHQKIMINRRYDLDTKGLCFAIASRRSMLCQPAMQGHAASCEGKANPALQSGGPLMR